MGDRLGTPGAVDFFPRSFFFSLSTGYVSVASSLRQLKCQSSIHSRRARVGITLQKLVWRDKYLVMKVTSQ